MEYIQKNIELFILISDQPFFLRAIVGGILVSILTAIIGVFITLRKESFFAEGVAHSSLTGIALGILFSFNPLFGALLIASFMAILFTLIKKDRRISSDSAIGIIYPGLFSIGVLLISINNKRSADLESFIFGNILNSSYTDIFAVTILFLITALFISRYYKDILFSTLSPDLAKVSGVNVDKINLIFTLISALVVIFVVKMVGIILVTAFLTVPAIHAKIFARKFSDMIPYAILHNLLSFIIGFLLSLTLPAGPSIVLVSIGILLLGSCFKQFQYILSRT